MCSQPDSGKLPKPYLRSVSEGILYPYGWDNKFDFKW